MTGFWHAMSFIGSAAFYVPLLVAVYWCADPRLGARAMILLTLSGVINGLLKVVFHDPRPYWTSGLTEHENQASFGMPSGHAQNAVVAWGFVGVWLYGRTRAAIGRRAISVVVVTAVALIGLSRVPLHVHSLGQVAAGWAVGAVLLMAALRIEPVVVPWWERRPLWLQAAVALLVALLFLAATELAVGELRGWRIPDAWTRAIGATGGAVKLLSLREGAAAAGVLFGGLSGVSWLAHRGWFDAGGALRLRLARLPVGLAGAAVLWWAGLLAGRAVPVIFVANAVLGLWVAAGAPELFVRTGLAGRRAADHPRPITRSGETRGPYPS
ncbi:phosphatase PAP2 family protein [Actinomadura scrupuli]|uniref:phosphatase PAP2 family protein n=1 Tax=Actinomadura scrupuli TaxID=559629 RepID=UPI003D95E3C5